jgi:hypothetical protein
MFSMADKVQLTKQELISLLKLAWFQVRSQEDVDLMWWGGLQKQTQELRNFLEALETQHLKSIDQIEKSRYSTWQPYSEDDQ